MKRKTALLLVLVIAVLVAISVALAQQHKGSAKKGGMQNMAQQHGMGMMTDMRSPAEKKAVATLAAAKKKHTKEGHYNCCLKHPCDFCEMMGGGCPCGMHAAKDMPVCNECKGGWMAGDGAIPGKKPSQIKTGPRGKGM